MTTCADRPAELERGGRVEQLSVHREPEERSVVAAFKGEVRGSDRRPDAPREN